MAIKITLRKAHALQKSVQELLNSIEIKTQISLNEFQDPAQEIATAAQAVLNNDVRRSDLLMTMFTIRTLAGTANHTSGINMRLSHAAYLDKRIAQLTPLINNNAAMDEIAVIAGKLEKIRTRPADSRASLYHRGDEVDTGVLSREQIDNIRNIIAELKKQKVQVNDEILDLNVRTEFELTPEVEAILVREKLI